jgi:hypothetical protein
MNWKSHGYLILSKFFYGYGAGFATAMGVISSIDPTQITAWNLAVYPCLSGMVMVFPQLSKTFLEASNKRV